MKTNPKKMLCRKQEISATPIQQLHLKERSILNHQQLGTTTPVSLHFNQAGHSINDVHLIPIELIRSKRDSV